MAEIKITGTTRTEFGKGASRRARVAGLVPAVIYGHGEAPKHITLPARIAQHGSTCGIASNHQRLYSLVN